MFADAGNDTVQGGAGDDYLVGWDGTDVIYGDDTSGAVSGADYMRGDAGNDSLYGGGGADTIQGGEGSDLLTGGAGGDQFRFGSLNTSPTTAYDTVADFSQLEGDTIDLSIIDANPGMAGDQAFSFVAAVGGSFLGGGTAPVRWYQSAGNTFVEADTGDSVADMAIMLTGTVSQRERAISCSDASVGAGAVGAFQPNDEVPYTGVCWCWTKRQRSPALR